MQVFKFIKTQQLISLYCHQAQDKCQVTVKFLAADWMICDHGHVPLTNESKCDLHFSMAFSFRFVKEQHFQNEDVQFADVSRALCLSWCRQYVVVHVHWAGDMRVGLKITLLL